MTKTKLIVFKNLMCAIFGHNFIEIKSNWYFSPEIKCVRCGIYGGKPNSFYRR